jgi:hypothetical protein
VDVRSRLQEKTSGGGGVSFDATRNADLASPDRAQHHAARFHVHCAVDFDVSLHAACDLESARARDIPDDDAGRSDDGGLRHFLSS